MYIDIGFPWAYTHDYIFSSSGISVLSLWNSGAAVLYDSGTRGTGALQVSWASVTHIVLIPE